MAETIAAGAVGELGPTAELAAAIVGGTLAAVSHVTRAGSRVLINTSPEPFSNWVASIGEDILVILGLWAALTHPVAFLVALLVFAGLMIWLLPKLWRGTGWVFARIRAWFGGAPRSLFAGSSTGTRTTAGCAPPVSETNGRQTQSA
jgi:hypothetical protein